jgi:transcriptional regulator with XRE-family HTH domain
MNLSNILDQARSASDIPSDYALAKRLGIPTQHISNWRNGRGFPSPLISFQLAKLAQLDPGQVIAWLETERAERAGNSDQVHAWRELLTKPASIAASVIFAFSISASPETNAAGTISQVANTYQAACILC